MSVKLCKYTSAVRGYNHYFHHWQPVVGKLGCVHKRDNPFDLLAIAIKKTVGEDFKSAEISNE